jgi:hypothetical protein
VRRSGGIVCRPQQALQLKQCPPPSASTLHPSPSTLHPLMPHPDALNPKPYILNPESPTDGAAEGPYPKP